VAGHRRLGLVTRAAEEEGPLWPDQARNGGPNAGYHSRAGSGVLANHQSPTVAAFLQRWLESIKPTIRESTWVRYEGLSRVHLIPALGRTRLDRLTPEQIDRFLADRLAGRSAPRTVHHMRAVLRAALTEAMRWELLGRNPVALTRSVRVPRIEARRLTQHQARQLLDSVKGDRLEARFTVALGLGLRQGEILGLRWRDVNLEQRQLTVNHTLHWLPAARSGSRAWFLGEPKSKLSRRQLPLPTSVAGSLREHRARQIEECLLVGVDWTDPGFVFTREAGVPLDGDRVRYSLQASLARAGLAVVAFHQLRHSSASLLIAHGVPLKVVSEGLGHSTIALTANTYSHLSEELWRGAADAMDRALGMTAQPA
jgi:integrase